MNNIRSTSIWTPPVFNGQQGHTVQIGGGAGFIFTGCEFGGNGTYKYAANTYDEINIAGNVGGVTIDACHFNVDALAGHGSSNSPRSAVYATSGPKDITVANSRGAGAAGYGTSPIVDDANAVMRRGNVGLGLADTTVGSGAAVTTATNSDLSAAFTWGSTPTVSNNSAQTVNTTQPNQIALVAEWASAAGSPVITCLGTVLERLPSCQGS